MEALVSISVDVVTSLTAEVEMVTGLVRDFGVDMEGGVL